MSIYYKTLKYNIPVELVGAESGSPLVKIELNWTEIGENFPHYQKEGLLRDFLGHVSDNSLHPDDEFEGDPWDHSYSEFIVWAKFLCNRETPEPPVQAVGECTLRKEALDSIDHLCDTGMSITRVDASRSKEYGIITIQFKRKK